MNTAVKRVYIVGVGLGQEAFLTEQARRLLTEAPRVYTTARIGDQLLHLLQECVTVRVAEIAKVIRAAEGDVVVMVSGDTGFYSLASTIARRLGKDEAELIYINGISSMQYFFARLGRGFEQVKLLSVHGRNQNLVAQANYNPTVFTLTGSDHSVQAIAQQLRTAGMDFVRLTVGEDLGSAQEKLYTMSPSELIAYAAQTEISPLSVLLIENPRAVNPDTMLRDGDFLRGDAPMTKEEIRHLSITKLNIQPQDIVYDIGAGTGSCSLEMAKKARESCVYALEQKQEAYDLLCENKRRLDIYNVEAILAKAPDGLSELPPADKVFIGGSGKSMGRIIDRIIETARAAQRDAKEEKRIRFVINTIALESLAEAQAILAQGGFTDVEYTSVNIAKSKEVGPYHMMMAHNPIFVIRADYVLAPKES